MSTLLYAGKIFQGKPELRAAVPASQLLVDVSIGHILSGSSSMTITSNGVYSLITPADRDPALDIYFDCQGDDSAGVGGKGVLVATGSIHGTWPNTPIAASVLTITGSILGTYNGGVIITGLLTATISLLPSDTFIPFVLPVKANWVKWSNIGDLDFTVGKDNVAGERPLDWKGYVYAVKKLNDRVVVYGQNGVSMLIPVDVAFGLKAVYRVGLKSKHAVAGDETKHFFVDNSGQLWKLSDSLQMLGYSEYLSEMLDNIVLSYDKLDNQLYICDGSVGYVFDVVTGSLGKCSPNITGVDYQSGVQFVTASADITTDPFEVCTDIYDLGIRTSKTIFSLEFGTNLSTGLYAAIDYRRDIAASFTRTPWYSVSSIGKVFITAYGREFKIRVKTLEYEYFELDYIKVNGVANAY